MLHLGIFDSRGLDEDTADVFDDLGYEVPRTTRIFLLHRRLQGAAL